jgi:hypothetical protein
MTIKIIVAHHKEGDFYKDKIHLPIHVGRNLAKNNLEILRDDTKVNISHLNPFYCELTATFWAWKNINAEYLGLCHYRRYFSKNKDSKLSTKNNLAKVYHYFNSIFSKNYKGTFFYHQRTIKKNQSTKIVRDFSMWLEKDIEKENVDIYALKPVLHLNKTNFDVFNVLGSEFIDQLKNIVNTNFPDYYKSLNLTLSSNTLHYANMVVMKSDLFNEYCEFIFGVLKIHFEKNKQMVEETDSYLRIPGYMGELLTNTFIIHKQNYGLKIKLLKSVFIE